MARTHPHAEFPILTGVSAGAINAAHLASCTEPFPESVERLVALWRTLTLEQVFRTDLVNVGSHMLRWALRLIGGGSTFSPKTHGMVNIDPLRETLRRAFNAPDGRLSGIEENIAAGRLAAIGITTTDYSIGQAITWTQGREVAGWSRPGRRSQPTALTVDHIVASCALPLFFPAIKIGSHWHGDGGVQMIAPLSPAVYLGAGRIIAMSNRHVPDRAESADEAFGYPSPANVIGLLLRAIFLDMFDYDAVVIQRVNELLRCAPPGRVPGLRPVELLLLRPSVNLAQLANEFEPDLPRGFRFALRGLGTRHNSRADLLATLLFEPNYIGRLIEIGERDALARRDEIGAFIAPRPKAAAAS
jgi:NTE family protein